MPGSSGACLVIALLSTLSPAWAAAAACTGSTCRQSQVHHDDLMMQTRRVTVSKAAESDCWQELSGLAVDEGDNAGGDLMNEPSVDGCKAACGRNHACQSFSSCPQWKKCWMRTKTFSGDEPTKELGACKTFYRRACASSPVPAPSPFASICWGGLSELVSDEGAPAGGDLTNSPSIEDCKSACSGNADCQSFSSCPQWNSCWMKGRILTGGEPTRKSGSCKTFYKRACDDGGEGGTGSTPPPPPPPAQATPAATPSPPMVACWGTLPALAADEGASASGDLKNRPSIDQCKAACADNAACNSFSSCPQWNGCFMKTRRLKGDESTKQQGECKTFYRTSCDGADSAPTPAPVAPTGHKINVVAYNLFWWNAFNANPWKGDQICQNIKDTLQPDVLGVQECDNPGHVASRSGLKVASTFAGGQGSLVNGALFTVGETGSRDIQATGKWGARFATYVELTHLASGRTFWHFNTHWCVSHCDADKRYVGAQNMLKLIREKAGDAPAIITGDFNMFEGFLEEPGMKHFLQNGFSVANTKYVDAILFSTAHWHVLSKAIGWNANSDHEPIIAELGF